MQAGLERDAQQRMPGRMELNLVEPVAVAVERAKLRRRFVGVEAKLHGLRLTQRGAERRELAVRPSRLLAPDRLAQHGVAREQIIGLKRRRLVADLEHSRSPSPVIPGHAQCA